MKGTACAVSKFMTKTYIDKHPFLVEGQILLWKRAEKGVAPFKYLLHRIDRISPGRPGFEESSAKAWMVYSKDLENKRDRQGAPNNYLSSVIITKEEAEALGHSSQEERASFYEGRKPKKVKPGVPAYLELQPPVDVVASLSAEIAQLRKEQDDLIREFQKYRAERDLHTRERDEAFHVVEIVGQRSREPHRIANEVLAMRRDGKDVADCTLFNAARVGKQTKAYKEYERELIQSSELN